jgi:lipopolysaccharide transport system ATP-binding protein
LFLPGFIQFPERRPEAGCGRQNVNRMSVVVRVENVSKKYQLGKIGTQSMKGDLQRWWARKRGKEDPFGTIGEENNGHNGEFWALKDVSFDIHQGEAFGIIGKNGAGKSTLLKVLSRITLPTTGRLRVKGRIASLLEVGTGFNPDLTGRENAYLNGAILGMTKREVARKFDEIVDFSGVEKFIDTPVKRYSSGMYVRLAFAVAAHLDSEILILDEVLAVGDAEFQKKCLGKMDDVAHKQGRTVLFVSHGLQSVASLCNKAIYLEEGRIRKEGKTEDVIAHYLNKDNRETTHVFERSIDSTNPYPFIRKAWFEDEQGQPTAVAQNGRPLVLKIEIINKERLDAEISIAFFDNQQTPLWNFTHSMHGINPIPREENIVCSYKFYPPKLTVDELFVHLATGPKGGTPYYDHVVNALSCPVVDYDRDPTLPRYRTWPIECSVDVKFTSTFQSLIYR